MNEKSSTLRHLRLGNISVKRIKRLANGEVLETFDFLDFDSCVDCIKRKANQQDKQMCQEEY